MKWGASWLLFAASVTACSLGVDWDALRAGAGDLPEGGAIADGGASDASGALDARDGAVGPADAALGPYCSLAAHTICVDLEGDPSPLNLTAHVNGTSTLTVDRASAVSPPSSLLARVPAGQAEYHAAAASAFDLAASFDRGTITARASLRMESAPDSITFDILRIALEKDTTSRGVAVRVTRPPGSSSFAVRVVEENEDSASISSVETGVSLTMNAWSVLELTLVDHAAARLRIDGKTVFDAKLADAEWARVTDSPQVNVGAWYLKSAAGAPPVDIRLDDISIDL
ncbi:MAG: hypothetical protein U0270_22490 [Labilithrix sp.]